MTKEELFDTLVISIEHGRLCFRTDEQWLLHDMKLEDIPDMGIHLSELEPVLDAGIKMVTPRVRLASRE